MNFWNRTLFFIWSHYIQIWHISILEYLHDLTFFNEVIYLVCVLLYYIKILRMYMCSVFGDDDGATWTDEMRSVFFVSRDFKKNKYLSHDRFRFGKLSFQVPTDCHVQTLLNVYAGTVNKAVSRIYCLHCSRGIDDLRT